MKSLSRGLLIVLEGIDGSGKSTLAKTVFNTLKNQELPVLLTKEPGGSLLGSILRPFLQEQKITMCPEAEFLLFAADRAQHFTDVIIPELNKKALIISDRLADSSLVYQGFGRGLNLAMLTNINEWIMRSIKPDLTLYLKVDILTARERLYKRSSNLTTFEQDQIFFKKVVEGFDQLYSTRKDVIILDAEQSVDALHNQALEQIAQWLITNQIVV